MSLMRLDKMLSELGIGSRKEIRKLIVGGRVRIDETTVKNGEIKINPLNCTVFLDDEPLEYESFEYFMLNKPAGYVTARRDKVHKTVMELIAGKRKDLSPIGRLDIDTEGLLLISNDGQLAHDLLSPVRHVDKTYFVRVDRKLNQEDVESFRKGIILEDAYKTKTADLEILKAVSGESEANLKITEGKFHQVKRMFAMLDANVLYLKRIGFGGLWLDEKRLPRGESRKLTKEEIEILRKR